MRGTFTVGHRITFHSASDSVWIFCVEFEIFNKGEEEDRALHPEEKDPFQEYSDEATGSEEAMQQEELPLNEKGQGEKAGQKEIHPEESQKNPPLSVYQDSLQGSRRIDLQMISVQG